MQQKSTNNHNDMRDKNVVKTNNISGSSKLRAFIAGLTPTAVFRLTFISSVVIVVAAGILWHTATDTLHVNVNKVETDCVVLNGSEDLGGIELGGYKAVEWSVSNQSTKPAYVFVRIVMTTPGLYEVEGSTSAEPEGWSRVTTADDPCELVYAYTGGSGAGSM